MCSNFLKKNNISGKALLLLGIYLLHFVFFQSFVADFSDSHLFSTRSFFSDEHNNTNPSSSVAIFRTLEKHEAAHQTFKLSKDMPASISKIFQIDALIDEPFDIAFAPVSFHFSNESYRLYARDCVFRI